ncbi:hypothetical protein [Bacillus sp. MUM 116]|nr:hypothetical protein [Bacillus sp. MUM 116]
MIWNRNDRKNTEKALLESEKKYRLIAEPKMPTTKKWLAFLVHNTTAS